MSIEYKNPVKNVTPGGRIRFYKGLGLDRGYSNSIFFETKAKQEAFFAKQASNEITYNNGSKDAPTMVVKSPFTRSFKIPVNSAEVFPYDYIEVTPNISGSGNMAKRLYMFITGVTFVNDNFAQIEADLDVIQTFMFDWSLGTQKVEQMHSEIVYLPFADELKTTETFQPIPVESTEADIETQSLTNDIGYMVAVTSLPLGLLANPKTYIGWEPSETRLYPKPISERDANQLVYVYITAADGKTAVENLLQFLNQIDNLDRMKTIKRVYACPPILQGKPPEKWIVSTYGDNEIFGNFSGCKIRVPGTLDSTFSQTAPTAIRGYTPLDPKTYNLLTLRISTTLGSSFDLTKDDIHKSSFDITIRGVGGINPEILIFPSVNNSGVNVPAIQNKSGSVSSYNAPVISMASFPSYTIINSDEADAFDRQFNLSMINNFLGIFTKVYDYLGGY